MVTEPDSNMHSPGGRFHFELENPTPTSTTCTNGTGTLRLCTKPPAGHLLNYCDPHNLAAVENCDGLESRVITGLLAPLFNFPMKKCKELIV